MREKISCDHDYIAELALNCEKAIDNVIFEFRDGGENWSNRAGGYLCIADGKNGLPILVMMVGEVPLNKASKCLELCQEKAARLADHTSHKSSWQSRDEEKKRFAGAIRFRDLIFSFSGLPELGDEVAMVLAARYVDGDSFLPSAEQIVKLSGNPYWDSFC